MRDVLPSATETPIAEENQRLRASIRDLLALSALPALWIGRDPGQIAGNVLDLLLSMLRLDLAYARVEDWLAGSPIEVVRADQRPTLTIEASEVGRILAPWLNGAGALSIELPDPFDDGTLRCSVVPIGLIASDGVIVAASRRADFPTTFERMLLEVAVRQAVVALEEARLVATARAGERQAALGSAVGAALTSVDPLRTQLQHCARAITDHLDAAFARIWTLNVRDDVLELQASAGLYTHLDGGHSRVPVGTWKIGAIARDRQPHLTNDILTDPRISDRDWARREGMVSFAGFPLLVEDRLVGVMAMFARRRLSSAAITALRSVADEIAIGIDRARAEERRAQLLILEQSARAEAERAAEREHLRAGQLRALADAALAINGARSTNAALEIVTETARAIVGAHQAVTSLTVNDDLAQAITTVRFSDAYAAWRDYAAPPDGSGIDALVCETNRPLRMTQAELERHPRWRRFGAEAQRHPPLRGWLAAPLVARDGHNLGLIQLSDKRVGEFTESDEAILVQLAQMASVAIENARLYEQAQQAVEAREQFLGLAAHELKTPLTTIKGSAQLLARRLALDEPDIARAIGLTAQLRQQIERLETLVADLLDASRVQQGWLELRLARFDVAQLARAVAGRFEHPNEIESPCAVWIEAAEPVVGDWDPARVDQVLTNLISNAVKYSPEGGEVMVRVAAADGQAEISVRDHGIGIPLGEQATLFQPFMRGVRARETAGGTGLGLHIAAQIIARHGGTIAVESAPGSGSTFTVRLPLAPPAPTDDTERPVVQPGDDTSYSPTSPPSSKPP